MKANYHKRTGALLLIVIGAVIAIILMGHLYLRGVSSYVYEESTSHLMEVYSQVNQRFSSFLEQNWGNLNDWDHHLYVEDEEFGIKRYYC